MSRNITCSNVFAKGMVFRDAATMYPRKVIDDLVNEIRDLWNKSFEKTTEKEDSEADRQN